MKILLCRGSAQKIGTDSGKKLLKKIKKIKSYNYPFTFDKTQTTKYKQRQARPYRPTCPGPSFKKINSNNLIQKIKQKIPIQPKITTSTTVIPKTRSKTQNTQPKTPSPYDRQNPYKEPQSGPKDIRGKDIKKDLIENDPLKGPQTDRDTEKSDATESDKFETIAPEKDNPVKGEFEIGQLSREELKEDERAREESSHGATGNTQCSGTFIRYDCYLLFKVS